MKRNIYAALVLSAVLGLTGCDRPMDPEGAHRAWWSEHHRDEAFDHDRAVSEHRDWCAHNHDRGCEGWK